MIKTILSLLILCLAGVPVLVYWVGGLLVGPYQGEDGILGMMRTIYVDALTGQISALVLLFAPVLLVGIWVAVMRLRRLA